MGRKKKGLKEAREEFAFKVGTEGLDYAIENYSGDLCALDPEFNALCEQHEKVVASIRQYMAEHGMSEEG